jgi:hypothetical protein
MPNPRSFEDALVRISILLLSETQGNTPGHYDAQAKAYEFPEAYIQLRLHTCNHSLFSPNLQIYLA